MSDLLRIELTPEEAEERSAVAVTFSVRKGCVAVGEEWPEEDEIYGDGCDVRVPLRVWKEAMPWIAQRIAEEANR